MRSCLLLTQSGHRLSEANVRSQTGETVPMKTETPFLGRVNTLLRTQLVETLEDHTDILRLFRIWIHVLKPTH